MKTKPEKIMVVGFDSDGIVLDEKNYTEWHGQWNSPESLADRIVSVNQGLFSGALTACADREIDSLYFLTASAGQVSAGNASKLTVLQKICEKVQLATGMDDEKASILRIDCEACPSIKPDEMTLEAKRCRDYIRSSNRPHYKKYFNRGYDDSKFSVVYRQIHHIATLFPDADISYYFIDARIDTHKSFYNIFSRYPSLIPRNVSVHLLDCQLDDQNVFERKMYLFLGKGDTDPEYSETLKTMWRYASVSERVLEGGYPVLTEASERLADLLIQTPTEGASPLDSLFEKNEMEQALKGLLEEFPLMKLDLEDESSAQFADALTNLYEELKLEVQQLEPAQETVVALANETRTLLQNLRQTPFFRVETPTSPEQERSGYLSKVFAMYQEACQKISGIGRFGATVGTVVTTGLAFAGGVMISGMMVGVALSLVAAGSTSAVMMRFGLFKPDRFKEKAQAVIDTGREWSKGYNGTPLLPHGSY